MHIDIYDNGLEPEDVVGVPHSTACRGILQKDGLFLVTRLQKYDIYMFPGGRLEPNESLEECVVREVLEETGVVTKVVTKTLDISEYFSDSSWTNHYFILELIEDTGEASLTSEEVELGLERLWLTQDELFDIFEHNMTLHEHGPNVHNREFLGLMNSI